MRAKSLEERQQRYDEARNRIFTVDEVRAKSLEERQQRYDEARNRIFTVDEVRYESEVPRGKTTAI